MIQCKRVYDPQETSDGYRILVDRLWPRGIKKEALNYNEWCKTLTPSADLRKAFHSELMPRNSVTCQANAERQIPRLWMAGLLYTSDAAGESRGGWMTRLRSLDHNSTRT